MTNKGNYPNDFITTEKDGELTSYEKELSEIFKENCEYSINFSRKKTTSIENIGNPSFD